MRPSLLAASVTAAASVILAPALMAQKPHLTVERVAAFPNLAGTLPTSPVWSPDSARIAFLWNDKGYPFRDVWLAERDGKPRRVTDMAAAFPEPAPPGHCKDAAAPASAATRRR